MTIIEAIGFGAASCTTLSFVPQVLKVWRTKSVADISLTMYLVFFVGLVQWFVYGILLQSWPIIIANAVTMMLAGELLVRYVVLERRAS
jgi:MtN3 and saliva related transmembrane protein